MLYVIRGIIKIILNLESCTLSPGGVLPRKRPMGMSHFHNWIDYNGVTFSVELLEWGRTFSGYLR